MNYFLHSISDILDIYFARTFFLIMLLIILVDKLVSNHQFKFTYRCVRFLLLAIWVVNLVLLFYNFERLTLIIERSTVYYRNFWITLSCFAYFLPLLLFFPKIGKNKWWLLFIGTCSTLLNHIEIYVIILTSMHQDFYAENYLVAITIRPIIVLLFIIGADLIIHRNRKNNEPDKPAGYGDDILDN